MQEKKRTKISIIEQKDIWADHIKGANSLTIANARNVSHYRIKKILRSFYIKNNGVKGVNLQNEIAEINRINGTNIKALEPQNDED